jgi:hypothetical protein
MNFDVLDKLIPARHLPYDAAVPRAKLYDMFRDLEQLRQEQTDPDIERQRKCYERLLE